MKNNFKNKTGLDFDTFYKKHYKSLLNWLNFTYNIQDASEIVNDSFIICLQKIDQFKPELGPLKTWLYTIAKHIATSDYYHGSKIIDTICFTDYPDTFSLEDSRDEYDYTKDKSLEQFLEFLKELDKEYNGIFQMRLEGISIRQIALEKNITISQVKNILYLYPKLDKYKKLRMLFNVVEHKKLIKRKNNSNVNKGYDRQKYLNEREKKIEYGKERYKRLRNEELRNGKK